MDRGEELLQPLEALFAFDAGSYSSTVSQLFWPMSWPNVSRRIVASTSSVKWP